MTQQALEVKILVCSESGLKLFLRLSLRRCAPDSGSEDESDDGEDSSDDERDSVLEEGDNEDEEDSETASPKKSVRAAFVSTDMEVKRKDKSKASRTDYIPSDASSSIGLGMRVKSGSSKDRNAPRSAAGGVGLMAEINTIRMELPNEGTFV